MKVGRVGNHGEQNIPGWFRERTVEGHALMMQDRGPTFAPSLSEESGE